MMLEEALPRSPLLQRLFADWRVRRNGTRFPKRADFDPADFVYILSGLSLLEIHRDPLRFRCRVHGTAVAEMVGVECTGKYIDEHLPERYLNLVQHHFADVVTTGRPSVAWLEDVIGNHPIWFAETLVLPLSRDGEALDLLLSAVSHQKRGRLAALTKPRSRIFPLEA